MNNDQQSRSAPPVGLGTHSARGLVYLFSSSVVAKFVSIAAQIALSWLLSKNDYGVVFLAFTITILISVIEQAGVSDVLVRRRRYHLWAIPGFWLSLALGALGSSLVLLAAPIAAAIYRDPQLLWVLLVLAPTSVPNALMAVPRAKLARELRFSALAGINLANITLRMGLTVLFAALGFGPYSFVVPFPITTTLVAAFMWWWVRPPWSAQLRLRRWRYLIGDSSRLLAADFCRAVHDQSDYMMLGLFRTVAQVGIYAFGYQFSIQMIQLFTVNLTNILFPALTKLNDQPQQQLQGFLKAQRILAMLGTGSCLLQAAAAEPLARLVFAPRWEPSIIVMQLLSLGMATRMVAGSSFALLKSQGRFRALLLNRLSFVLLQIVALAVVLATGGEVVAIAATVALIASVMGPVAFYMAVRPYGAGWAQVMDVLARPTLCGLAAAGTARLVAISMAESGYGNLPQLVVTVVITVALNVFLAWLCMRPVWNDLWARVWKALPTRVRNEV